MNQKWTLSVCSQYVHPLVSFLFCCLFLLPHPHPLNFSFSLFWFFPLQSTLFPSKTNTYTLSLSHTHSLFLPTVQPMSKMISYLSSICQCKINCVCACINLPAALRASIVLKQRQLESITIPISSDLCHSLSLNRPANVCTLSSNIHPHLSSKTLENFKLYWLLFENYIYIQYIQY